MNNELSNYKVNGTSESRPNTKIKLKDIIIIILIIISLVVNIIHSSKRIDSLEEIINSKNASIEVLEQHIDFFKDIASPTILDYLTKQLKIQEEIINEFTAEKDRLNAQISKLQNQGVNQDKLKYLKLQEVKIDSALNHHKNEVLTISNHINKAKDILKIKND